MPTATVRRGVAASDDRKRGTPPNCELRGRGPQLELNVDSGRLRRKDDAMVYITTITLSERGLSGRECPAQLSKIHRAAEPGLEMA